MRLAANIDANQPEIVEALKAVGASVEYMHRLGSGVPDLLVGYRSLNFIFELKDGNKPPSRRKLTEDEVKWHARWRGTVYIVESVEQALQILAAATEQGTAKAGGGHVNP